MFYYVQAIPLANTFIGQTLVSGLSCLIYFTACITDNYELLMFLVCDPSIQDIVAVKNKLKMIIVLNTIDRISCRQLSCNMVGFYVSMLFQWKNYDYINQSNYLVCYFHSRKC
jgi:hypothetical protein